MFHYLYCLYKCFQEKPHLEPILSKEFEMIDAQFRSRSSMQESKLSLAQINSLLPKVSSLSMKSMRNKMTGLEEDPGRNVDDRPLSISTFDTMQCGSDPVLTTVLSQTSPRLTRNTLPKIYSFSCLIDADNNLLEEMPSGEWSDDMTSNILDEFNTSI